MRLLAKNQPCGCVVCQCDDEERCHGCGSKHCGTHPHGEIPNPVYVDQQPTKEQFDFCKTVYDEIIQRIPSHWQVADRLGPLGRCYIHKICHTMSAVFTIAVHGDGQAWIHASIARTDRIPSYDELTKLKAEFIGPERKAIMVLPAEAEHVNIHPNCLHLFSCLGEDYLPDFTGGNGTL